MKWLLFILMCMITAMWIVYMALRAFNGIVYELDLIRIYLHRYDEPEAEEQE